MVAQVPLDWIEEIKQEIFALEAAPLLPPAPSFPVEALSKELHSRIGLAATIAVGSPKVINKEELKEQLSPTTSRLFSFALAPHTSPLYVLIGHEALNQLSAALLAGDLQAAVSLQSALQESFYLFLGAAMIDAVQATGYTKDYAPRLLSTAEGLKELSPMVSIPITVTCQERPLSLLLLIPPALQRSLKEQTRQKEEVVLRDAALSSKINLVARLLLELVPLHYSDIANLTVGSFLLLDKATTGAQTNIQVVVGKRAFFAGKITGDKMTITALAEPLEEIKKMNKPESPSPQPPAPEEKPGYFLGEDEEFFVEDEELSKVLKEQETAAPTTPEAPAAEAPKAPLQEPSAESAGTHITDVPLQVEVVVGYMRLSIKDLISMQVGGSYTLGSPISAHVDLLVNGKRIAKGELIKSGDVLGVRILSL